MSRNVVIIVAVLLALSINVPSSAVAMPTNTLTILPEDCKILAGKEMSLTLNGVLPSNTTINWDASDGGITSVLPGTEAVFIAPYKSTVVTISVSLFACRARYGKRSHSAVPRHLTNPGARWGCFGAELEFSN